MMDNKNIREEIEQYFGIKKDGDKLIVPDPVRVFIGWLHSKKVYSKFFYNFMNASQMWKEHYHCDAKHWSCFIAQSFKWPTSCEGSDFWLKIDQEWNKYCTQTKIYVRWF